MKRYNLTIENGGPDTWVQWWPADDGAFCRVADAVAEYELALWHAINCKDFPNCGVCMDWWRKLEHLAPPEHLRTPFQPGEQR